MVLSFVTGTTGGDVGEGTQLLTISVFACLQGALHRRLRALRRGACRRSRGAGGEVRGLRCCSTRAAPWEIRNERHGVGLLGLGALFVLFVLRMPVGLSMLITGFGTVAIRGWTHHVAVVELRNLCHRELLPALDHSHVRADGIVGGRLGDGRDLYDAAYAWVGHIRGGLASATVIACACFASLCGSAAGSAVTMGRVALPEMRRFKYDDSLLAEPAPSPPAARWFYFCQFRLVTHRLATEQAIGRRVFRRRHSRDHPHAAVPRDHLVPTTTSRKEAGPAGPRAGARSGSGPSRSRSASSPSSS